MRARRKIACVNTPCGVLGLPAGRAVSTSRGRALARKHCGDMKRPVVHITLRDAAGNVLHSETRSAFNSGVRASEAAVREIARKRGMVIALGGAGVLVGLGRILTGAWPHLADNPNKIRRPTGSKASSRTHGAGRDLPGGPLRGERHTSARPGVGARQAQRAASLQPDAG
jgi:hypothetical protein